MSTTTIGPPALEFVDVADIEVTRDLELPTRPERRQAARRQYVANLLPTFALLVAFDVAVVLNRFLAARVFAVAFLLLMPGALLVASSRFRPANGAVRLALVVAASVAFLMVAAVASSVVLIRLGVAQPLSRGPMVVVVNEVLGLLVLVVARVREPIAALLEDRVPTVRQVVTGPGLRPAPARRGGRGGGREPRLRPGACGRRARRERSRHRRVALRVRARPAVGVVHRALRRRGHRRATRSR